MKLISRAVIYLSFLFFLPVSAQDDARLTEFARSKAWLRIMHYLPEGKGVRSQLDGPGFFFAPNGDVDPLAELKASIEAFGLDKPLGPLAQPAQCAFPERFRLLRESLGLTYEIKPCPKFDEFLERFHGSTAVSVIFSSAYPNNPASMFGHSFLKIRSTRKNVLVDSGINFAAYTGPETNILQFMMDGVFGRYRGAWSMDPYFTKVNEYINSDSRDLWEYDLSLTAEETRRLIAHLWEMEINSHFEYYFFDENCSYQILRAIEAIKLDWELEAHHIYVIPGETIKRLTDTPGAVRNVNFRPSLYHQLQMRYASLDPDSRSRVMTLLAASASEAKQDTPEVLDTALLAHMFRRAKKKKDWSDEDQARENIVLELRAKNPTPAATLAPPPLMLRSRPDWGHDPYSIHLGGGWLHKDQSYEGGSGRLKVRSAYHDLMGKDVGYSPFSEIEFPWFETEYHDGQLRLLELGFVSTTSLFPLTTFSQKPSWRTRIAMETAHGLECQGCLMQVVEAGGGGTLGGDSYRLYALAIGRGEVNPELSLGYRIRPGVEVGTIWNPVENYKTRLLGRMLWSNVRAGRADRDFEFKWDHSFSLSRNQEIRQESSVYYTEDLRRPAWSEIHLQWIQYFR